MHVQLEYSTEKDLGPNKYEQLKLKLKKILWSKHMLSASNVE